MHHPLNGLGSPFVGLPPGAGFSADAYISSRVFGQKSSPPPGGASSLIVTNEATDTTCFPLFVTAATGDLAPKSNSNLAFNSNTGLITLGGGYHVTGGTVGVATTASLVGRITGTVPVLEFIDSSRSADGRITDIVYSGGSMLYRYVNDAHSVAANYMAVIGTSASITSVTFPNGSVAVTNALSMGNISSAASVRGGAAPSAATGQVQSWMNGTAPIVSFVDTTQAANGKIIDLVSVSGGMSCRFINDIYSVAANIWRGEGTSAGVTLFTVPVATSSVFGHTASVTVGNAGKVQISGTTAAAAQSQISGFANDATTAGTLALSKSRGAIGVNTIVASGDILGSIVAYGADGSNYDPAAAIRFESDGTPASGTDMPGRLVFLTSPDGTATLTEAFRINNAQVCTFAADPAGRILGTSGFTPTVSAAVNMDSTPTMSNIHYSRVGAFVTMGGEFTADPTAPGAASFEFTLPVASNIGATSDLAGTACGDGVAALSARLKGSVANNTAVVSWIAVDLTSQTWSWTATYRII